MTPANKLARVRATVDKWNSGTLTERQAMRVVSHLFDESETPSTAEDRLRDIVTVLMPDVLARAKTFSPPVFPSRERATYFLAALLFAENEQPKESEISK